MKKVDTKKLTVAFTTILLVMWVISRNFNIMQIAHKELETKKEEDVSPGPNIFFLETSGRRYLTLREACAIESAARAHPKSSVTLLSSTLQPRVNLTYDGDHWFVVGPEIAPNVQAALLDVPDILDGTPLAKWYSSGKHKLSQFHDEHMSDALRLALVWKRGGIYLDLDVIVLKSLGQLLDTVGLRSKEGINGAVLSFQRGSPFLESCMNDYIKSFKPGVYGNQGPLLLTRVLKETCGGENLTDFVGRPQDCGGVTVLPQVSFYPVRYQDWKDLFLELDHVPQLDRLKEDTFTVHLYAKLTRSTMTKVGSGSVIDTLAKEYCPSTYRYISLQVSF